MSYRNPQIITDRSSEIYAQGFAKLGQQVAGVIENENERQRKIIEEQDKEDKAFKLILNDKTLKAYKHADEVYSKVKGSSLLEQFEKTYTGLLEGDGKNEGAIKAETILALRGSDLSADERKRLYKQVSDAKAYEETMIQAGGYIENDKNEYKENGTAGNIGNKFAWVGADNEEKFGNMLAMFSIADEEVPWAESKKDLIRKDGVNTIHVDTRINTKDDKAAKYIKDLKLEGKFGEVDEDGYLNIHWEKDAATFGEKGLMVEIPSAFDKAEGIEKAGLTKNGNPIPGLIEQRSNIVTSTLNGKKVTTTRQYLSGSEFINSNKKLTDEIETHAAGIVNGTSLSEQQAYMQRLKGYEFNLEKWSEMDPDEKIKQITDNLSNNMLSELGLGSFVPKTADDADVKFYKEQLGKDIVKGETIYVKTKESFSDIAKDPNKSPTQTEVNRQRAIKDFKYISKKLNDKDFNYSTKNLTDLATSFGVNYEADLANEDDTLKGSILNYGGKKITISKDDSRENIFKKILQLRVPGLQQEDYDKAIKELKKGGTSENIPKWLLYPSYMNEEITPKKGDNKVDIFGNPIKNG